MADLPTQEITAPTPEDYVNSQDYWDTYYAWLARQYAANYYSGAYGSITDFAWDSYAQQPNLVELPKRDDPELDEMVVEAERPRTILADPYGDADGLRRDSEGYSYNPATGINYGPTWAMNDDEYADFLGGGDTGYELMWEERHPDDDPDELFVGPAAIPQTPTSPGFRGSPAARPGIPGNWSFEPPGPGLDTDTPRYLRNPPKPTLPPLNPFPALLRWVLSPLALLFPQPMGPRAFDEAPDWWDLPPVRYRPGPTVTPLPDFEVPTIEYPIPRRIDFPDYSPGERRSFPISDDPGLFTDPVGIPAFPFPDFEIVTRPRTSPTPDWPTTFPFGDPFVPVIAPPRTDTPTQPGIPDLFGFPPGPGDRTTPSPPPRVADPFNPPETFSPVDPFTFAPPRIGVPGPDLLQFPDVNIPRDLADPNDPCDCSQNKKRKKKKSRPRDICYEGHYVEHSRGLTKKRGKQIPCA